jgi:stage II sporulation protein D
MKKQSDIFDLDATTSSQVYKGIAVENAVTTKYVTETAGQIMTYDNQPILAFFHSTCGGSTADNDQVWNGERISYLTGRVCNYCAESPYYRWKEDLPLSEIRSVIASKYPHVGKIKGLSFNRYHGRIVDAVIRHDGGMIKMTGNEFRMIFPEKRIKSMSFNAEKRGVSLHLEGKGWGHGVGMCQYGARGMAIKGAQYKQILTYYYKGMNIVTVNK